MPDVALAINSSLGCDASKKVEGLENKVKASMKAVLEENWITTDDNSLFGAGVGGALLDIGLDSEDGKIIVDSVNALRQFSGFIGAAQLGLNVEPPDINAERVVPLIKWWNEVKGES